MKCSYCGRTISGKGKYCGPHCQKRAAQLKVPFWALTGLAGGAALVGVVFFLADALKPGFLGVGGAAALEGLALLALTRRRWKRVLGGVLFALGVACVLLWR